MAMKSIKQPSKSALNKKPKSKKVIFIILFALIVSAVGIFLASSLQSKNISPAEADKLCNDFHDTVQVQLASTKNYSIVNSGRHCSPEEDEVGGTDYNQHANFVVAGGDNTSSTAVKNNLNLLSKQLHARDFNLSIYNIPETTNPPAICVSAYRYINNDGKVYSQGVDGVMPRYLTPGATGSVISYDDCIK